MQIEWWYWIVAGVVLLLSELVIPAFVLVWFGLGAMLVGILMLALPSFTLAVQLGLWLLVSVALVFLWFRLFKPGEYKTRIGMAEADLIGEVGLLTRNVAPFQKGEVRFQKPFLGSEVWTCIADEEIASGERVRVVNIEGSLIRIARA